MIQEIKIENIILIPSLSLNLSSSLNILTGETGSGKSILLNSLLFVLGERLDSSSLMDPHRKGFVQILFDISKNEKVKKNIRSIGIDLEDDFLLIRREIFPDKKCRNLMNYNPIPTYFLKTVGEYLLDFLSQHSHQSLLRVKNHKQLLDLFSDLENLTSKLKNKRRILKKNLEEKQYLSIKIENLKKEFNERTAIIKKIELLKIQEKEDIQIEEKIKKISKLGEIRHLIQNSYEKLYTEKSSVLNQIESIKSNLEKLSEYDPNFEKIYNDFKEATFLLQSTHEDLRNYRFSYQDSSDSLDNLYHRLYEINQLKRLYGPEISDIQHYLSIQKQKNNSIEEEEKRLLILNQDIQKYYQEIEALALEISRIRKEKSIFLEELIQKELIFLGMQDSRFKIHIYSSEISKNDIPSENDPLNLYLKIDNTYLRLFEDGFDQVEFLFKTNLKKDFQPLVRIASGGELSRVILAIKSVLVEMDDVGTLLLDEVDSGIGGEIAFRIGEKIKSLAQKKQIICITHLAQIAVKANQHFFVEKKSNSEIVKIYELNEEERVKEIARMLSGNNLTKYSIEHAKELIKKS